MANLFDVYNDGSIIDHTEGEKLETGETPITISGLTAYTTYDKVQVAFVGSYNKTDVPSFKTNPGHNLYINATQAKGYISIDDGTVLPPYGIVNVMVSDYIPVLPNTQYIFQAWGSLPSGQQYWAGIGQYDANKTFLNRKVGIYNAPTATTDIPNDYEKTMFTTDANTYFVRVSSRRFGNYKVKFERGNVPTPWIPAPEDNVT